MIVLEGIPISENQCIGDSLYYINKAFASLSDGVTTISVASDTGITRLSAYAAFQLSTANTKTDSLSSYADYKFATYTWALAKPASPSPFHVLTYDPVTATWMGSAAGWGMLKGDITSLGLTTTYNNRVPNNKGGAGVLTGILRADDGNVSVASPVTDYVTPSTLADYTPLTTTLSYIRKPSNPVTGSVLSYNGADWTSLTLPTGAVTSIGVGAGLNRTGGGDSITDTGTLNVTFGSTANTVCAGNDSRLNDSRAPISHTHPMSQINSLEGALASKLDITTASVTYIPKSIGATDGQYLKWNGAQSRWVPEGSGTVVNSIIGGTGLDGGVISTSGTLSVKYGTNGGTACQGNDIRLSDARTPLAHNQDISTINGLQNVLNSKTNTSDLSLYATLATLNNYATTTSVFGTSSPLATKQDYIAKPSNPISQQALVYNGIAWISSSVLNVDRATETALAPVISNGAASIDINAGSTFTVNVDSDVVFNFVNNPANGRACTFTLILISDGTFRNVTWPSSVKWENGVKPVLSITNGKADIFTFLTTTGGSTWYGFTAGINF